MRIAVNDFISGRGASGSAVGGGAILSALRRANYNTVAVSPEGYVSGNRLRNVTRMIAWDFVVASRMAKKVRADVMVNLANTGLGWEVPAINVLHDTMVLDHPSMFDYGYRKYAQLTFGKSVRAAAVNVVPSIHSKNQALRRWPKAKFIVIPWTSKLPSVATPVLERQSLNIVSIASSDRHKRLPMLIDAVNSLRATTGLDFKLTLVSRAGNDASAVSKYVESVSRQWINYQTNYVPNDELLGLIDTSFCIAASSVDEGFCIPLLEACRRGIPVVHTGRGAMNEVINSNPSFRRPADASEDGKFLLDQFTGIVDEGKWNAESRRSWEHSANFRSEDFDHAWSELIQEVSRGRKT